MIVSKVVTQMVIQITHLLFYHIFNYTYKKVLYLCVCITYIHDRKFN